MSDDRMPDLDEELRELFDAEQRRPGIGEEATRRLLEGVRGRIGPDGGGSGGGDGGAGGGGAPTAGPSAPAGGGSFLRSSVWLPVTTFVVGALVGATLHAALGSTSPTERVRPEAVVPSPAPSARLRASEPATTAGSRPVERIVASQTVADSPGRRELGTSPLLPEREEARGEGRRPRSIARPGGVSSDDLERERALVERARTALLRGEPSRAIEALRQHQRTFPSGQLAEERDALRVQALAAAGRQAEARDEAARFRREHPESILSPEAE